MGKTGKRAALALAIGATLAAIPAQAACWKADQVRAAKVRDLDTMLMVSALRCRSGADDFLTRYNDFVTGSRRALLQVNDRLRTHFAESVGQSAALDAFDNYVTKVANRYGAGVAGLGCPDMASIVAAATADGASFDSLADLADRASVEPVLDGPVCQIRVASLTH